MSAALAYALYAAIAVVAVVFDRVQAARGSLTIGRLLRRLTIKRPGRVVVLVAWAWLGWHVLVRGSVTFLR